MKKFSKFFIISLGLFLLLSLSYKIIKNNDPKNDFVWSIPLTKRYTSDFIIMSDKDSIYNEQGEDISLDKKYLIREVKDERVYKLDKGIYKVILRKSNLEDKLTLHVYDKQ